MHKKTLTERVQTATLLSVHSSTLHIGQRRKPMTKKKAAEAIRNTMEPWVNAINIWNAESEKLRQTAIDGMTQTIDNSHKLAKESLDAGDDAVLGLHRPTRVIGMWKGNRMAVQELLRHPLLANRTPKVMHGFLAKATLANEQM